MSDFAWKSLKFDIKLLKILSDKTVVPGNQYEWGGKVDDDADSTEVVEKGIDCSGYTKWLLARCADTKIPDGSVAQREWVESQGFKESTVDAALLQDGYLRIAFLAPVYRNGKMQHAGHVLLVRNGMTYESRGGNGPDRRIWNGKGFQANMKVFVLSKPEDQF